MIKKLFPILAGVVLLPAFPRANTGKDLLRAKQIEQRNEVVGGPVSVADVGDLAENDQIALPSSASRTLPVARLAAASSTSTGGARARSSRTRRGATASPRCSR